MTRYELVYVMVHFWDNCENKSFSKDVILVVFYPVIDNLPVIGEEERILFAGLSCPKGSRSG